jgi:hypothetical protein
MKLISNDRRYNSVHSEEREDLFIKFKKIKEQKRIEEEDRRLREAKKAFILFLQVCIVLERRVLDATSNE